MESKYFKQSEVESSHDAKRLGISNKLTAEAKANAEYLAKMILDPVRERFNTAIYISSWYRSPKLNKAIKGSPTSFHVKAAAADVDMDGRNSIPNRDIFHYIKDNLPFTELILEHPDKHGNPAWVHVGIVRGREDEKEILVAKRNSNGKTYYIPYSDWVNQ
jgi:hypothetical protein